MEINSPVEKLFEKGEIYIKTTLELAKLKSIETGIDVGNIIIAKIGMIIMLGLFIMMLNFGLALWLGDLMGKTYYGFFVIAGFYLLLGLIFHYKLPNWIHEPLSRAIIKKTLSSKK